jgi:phage baseplate assembly protein gpV
LVELDPRRTGSLSFLQNFAFTGGQETCDPDNPSVVHKDFQLDAGESTSIELESTGLEEGVYDVVLVSADGCASKDPSVEPVQPYGWSENKGSIEVVAPNRKPSISSVSVPGEVAKGEEFTASVQASDPDGDLLSIEWGNGETGDEASYSFDEVGEQTVSVTVSDGEASVSESITLEVIEGNSAPKIDQVILKDEVPLNEELTAVVDASDPDGDQLSYEWSNGDTGSEASFNFESTGLKTVSVTVSDGDKSVSKSGSVSVVEPEEPGIIEKVLGFFEGLFPF